jgi:hypothetical protein
MWAKYTWIEDFRINSIKQELLYLYSKHEVKEEKAI